MQADESLEKKSQESQELEAVFQPITCCTFSPSQGATHDRVPCITGIETHASDTDREVWDRTDGGRMFALSSQASGGCKQVDMFYEIPRLDNAVRRLSQFPIYIYFLSFARDKTLKDNSDWLPLKGRCELWQINSVKQERDAAAFATTYCTYLEQRLTNRNI